MQHIALLTLAQAGPAVEAPPPVREQALVPAAPGGAGPATELVPGAGATAPPDADAPPPASPFGNLGFVFFIVIIAVFWFMLMGGQRKEKKKRAAMLSTLKKGDKVQTIGGILGNVVEVRDHEVVVKVDENANTRLRLARSAIQSVVEDKSE